MFMLPWVIAARRGPLFPFVVVVIYSFYLMRPKMVNRAVIIGGLVFAGLAMLMLVTIRDYHTTAAIKYNEERFKNLTALDLITGKAYEESDNEYLYHCVFIRAYAEHERFQWGTGYLSLATHWIPRAWWPDKPALAHGWIEPLSKDEIFETTGVYMTTGAASGGIAETFVQMAWFTPLFWAGIGWVVGKTYLFARRHPNRVGPMIYVGMLAGSHWLISQGFGAAFVPVVIYMAVPVVIYTLASQRTVRTRVVPRARPAALGPPLTARSAT
jgi:hypothetical protein